MDEPGAAIPLGGAADPLTAVALTNADGTRAMLIREGEQPKALITVGTDARAGRILVTPLDGEVELRRDREAAAQWIAAGSVARRTAARVPAWADAIGLALVLMIFALTIVGALTVIGWLAHALV